MKTAKKAPLWAKILVGVAIFAGANYFINRDKFGVTEVKEEPQEARTKTNEEKARRWVTNDGEHLKVKRAIKAKLNDPDSYEHISTTYKINDNGTVSFLTDFRAKNALGALTSSQASGYWNLEGGEVGSITLNDVAPN